ncbi:MAG: hypothetical protein AB7L41_11100 [Flavobacteriaceae bacterium]
MSRDTETSYMRVATYTLAVLVGVMALVALFGGFEPSAIAAR